MRKVIVCPSCGTKTRADREECPHCEALLEPAATDPGPPGLSWRFRTTDIALLAIGAVALVVMGRQGRPVEIPQPPAPAVLADLAAESPAVNPQGELEGEDLVKARRAGKQWFEAGAYEQALQHYERVLAERPEDARAHSDVGQALVRLDRHREALGYFEVAVRLDAGQALFHTNFAAALADLGWWDRAVNEYRDAAAIQPGDYETVYRFGVALYETGDHMGAVKTFLEAIEIKPPGPGGAAAYLALGTSYRALGRDDDAGAAQALYLELAPNGPGRAEEGLSGRSGEE